MTWLLRLSQSNPFRLALSMIVSVSCLYLAVRGINFDQVLEDFKKSSPAPIGGAVLFFFLSLWIRGWRWRFLLLPVKAISLFSLFRSTLIGFMGNNLFPFRAGEVMRAVSVGQNEQVSKAAALGSIVLERILDGVVLSVLPFLLLAVLNLPLWILVANLALLGVYLVGFVTLVVIAQSGYREVCLRRITASCPGLIRHRLESIADSFFQGMKGINEIGALLPVCCLSLLCWFSHAMYYFLLFQAFGLSLSIWAALILLVVIAIGVLIPSAPGYVGNYEYSAVLGLTMFGVSQETAFAYAVLAHVVQFATVTAVGLLFAFKTGLLFQPAEAEVKIRAKVRVES